MPTRVPRIDDEVMAALISGDPQRLASVLVNDLHEVAAALCPRVEQVQQLLADTPALTTLVAGSGPTVAALAPDHASALATAETLRTADLADQVEVVTGPTAGARLLESVREDEE